MEEYKKYQHLEKYDRTEVNGLLDGTCYVFPKLDGTNGQVYMENGALIVGSRNRVLGLEKEDNHGFHKYILDNKEKYMKFFELFPNHRLFGEWLVPHAIKNYKDDAWRKFYVFDVCEISEDGLHATYVPYLEYKTKLEECGLDYIELLKRVENPDDNTIHELAESNNYLMKEGFKGEGVVIKNYSYKNKFGHIIWGKLVRQEFKEEKIVDPNEAIQIETKIAKEYCTRELILKCKAKIENEKGDFQSKMFPELFNRVYYDIVVEDMWDILKKHNNPRISFQLLQREIIELCKKEVF